jgi:hypothetical protein
VLVLLSNFVAWFISYLGLTPADYAADGTPAQNLPALLRIVIPLRRIRQQWVPRFP